MSVCYLHSEWFSQAFTVSPNDYGAKRKKKKKSDAAQADSAYFETWNSEKSSAARINGIFLFVRPDIFFLDI